MINLQHILRARFTRVALAGALIAGGAIGFAPYMLNNVSTQAAINAPLIRLTAAADGTVPALPGNGYYFAKPTDIKLLNLSQDTGEVADLRAQAETAHAQMELARRQLAELDVQEGRMQQRASLFTSATTARLSEELGAARAEVKGCEAERSEQQAALVRARKLTAQGFMSQAGIERAEAASLAKNNECAGASANLRATEVKLQAAQSGVFIGDSYNDAPYAVQQADRLLLQRQGVEKTLSDATAQYNQAMLRLKDALARATYRAPAGTLVWSASSSSGAAIRAGEPVLDLVDCRRRFVQVALPERKAEAIGPGSPANVRLIGSDQWMKGSVTNITGAAGRRDDSLLAASTYSLPGERQIMVDVALPAPAPDKIDGSRKCEVGRLAEVRFSRAF